MKVGDGALRMRGRCEDEALLIGQNVQPGGEVARVTRPRFEFGHDSEIGTEEAASEFGDQFLARAFASILVMAAEVAVDAMRGGRWTVSCARTATYDAASRKLSIGGFWI